MAMATTSTTALVKPFSFFSPSSAHSPPQSRLLCSRIPLRNRRFSISATMTPSSFLERRQSGSVDFVKYRGLGKHFILVNTRDFLGLQVTPEQAKKLCDRNYGIGADGVIFAMPRINGTDYTMRMFNSDGSEPEVCGNGVRCFAQFIADLENLSGRQTVTVDMGKPILKASDVPTKLLPNKDQSVVKSELKVDGITWNVTCVSMGNPHCVTFGAKGEQNLQVDKLNLAEIGPKFEHHEMFPARTNTEFVQVFSPSHLKMRVWEHGSGAILAHGTGACAVVVAAVLEGRARRSCTVDLPGGPLYIEWSEKDDHVYMTCPVKVVFCGSVPI